MNKRLASDEFVKWERGRNSDGYDSDHDSGADHELEDLLHNILDRYALFGSLSHRFEIVLTLRQAADFEKMGFFVLSVEANAAEWLL